MRVLSLESKISFTYIAQHKPDSMLTASSVKPFNALILAQDYEC